MLSAPPVLSVPTDCLLYDDDLNPRQREGLLDTLNQYYATQDAEKIMAHTVHTLFAGQIAMASSFGAEAVVLLHMLSHIAPFTPVLFINTGKLFGETLRYRDHLQSHLGLADVRTVGPLRATVDQHDADGTLWQRDTDACCHLRKVIPHAQAIRPFRALLTGRKRFQSNSRHAMPIMERLTDGDGTVHYKVNPLAGWQLEDLRAYVDTHALPLHPLVRDGYMSIGCMPCTDRVKAGDGYRSGRWGGTEKTECGIHENFAGDGI